MAEERVERRLAAILAVDVAGYSRLMGADEEGTLAVMLAVRRELGDPKIREHRGRIVKTTGDGLLVEFASVVDAVRCAVEVQRDMVARNVDVPAERRLEFRMGINVGDIIIEDGDIFGDGVNIAARLEALAEPGGICLSAAAHEQVRDRLEIAFDDLGDQQVKNITRPVRVYSIGSRNTGRQGETQVIQPALAALPVPEKPSIAVLPFQNMSGDAEQEYFADGVVEDIITALSHNRAFFVISRSTTFTYKGPAVDVAKVARELGVRYVLEGSVRRAGNRVRITAQLIDAANGRHLWADRYDRDMADVFAVQDEIARTITGELAPGIISAEMQQARRKDPSQLDAWDLTMRAHWHIRRFTREDMTEARCLLEQATAIDPANAMALGDLSIANHLAACFGWVEDVAQGYARAGDSARRAVAVDDGDAHAHSALAIYDLFQGRHEEARRRLRRALELDPNSAFAHGVLGTSYDFAGDYETALPLLDQAIRLSPRDPLVVLWQLGKGWAALLSERYEEAIEFATEAAEANPEFPDVHAVLAAAHGHLGNAGPAVQALAEFLRRMPVLTADDERLNRPFGSPAQRERFLEGLRKAGLPEK